MVKLAVQKDQFKIEVYCSILPRITNRLPARHVPVKEWNFVQNLEIADPVFNTPHRVDIHLGAQVFMKILRMEEKTSPGPYSAPQSKQLGCVVTRQHIAFRPVKHEQPSRI
jgi:hypothetical protein